MDKIRIINRDFKILEVDSPNKVHPKGDSDGYLSFSKQEIKILKTLNPQRKQEVLWHEVIHAIILMSELEDCFKDVNHEEKFTVMFTRILLDVIGRNSNLLKHLM